MDQIATAMDVTLQAAPASLKGTVSLTGSKSSSNRWLILEALAGRSFHFEGLSTATDTQVLQQALSNAARQINVGAAGTAMRFMTAYLAQKPGEFILSGEDRAHDRPIAILVDALRILGADIQYLEKVGYPPLHIKGKKLVGDTLTIDGAVSSQYLSALLLIACRLEGGLSLRWTGKLGAAPYVQHSCDILKEAGIQVLIQEQQIQVFPGEIQTEKVQIEPDWSSACYWLAFSCLLPTELQLAGLRPRTGQADVAAIDFLAQLGLHTSFNADGLAVKSQKLAATTTVQQWDFSACPDLAPTLIVLCAALHQKAVFTGLKSLRIKESDRLLALQTELAKFGAVLNINDHTATLESGCDAPKNQIIQVASWKDHRIVMAMSLLSAVGYQLYFDQAEVVSKSYPAFWEDLAKFGFQLNVADGR